MKKIIKYHIAILGLMLGLNLYGQEAKLPGTSGEQIVLQTDRSLYVVNEEIHFLASYNMVIEPDEDQSRFASWAQSKGIELGTDMRETQLSTVLYVELIRWNGDKISQVKYQLSRKGAEGSLTIPSDVVSGNYYLRAYTKWMRNFSPYSYAYFPVEISNPYTSKTDRGPGSADNDKIKLIESPAVNESGIIKAVRDSYAKREAVHVNLEFQSEQDIESYSVAVVKKGSLTDPSLFYLEEETVKNYEGRGLEYLPELFGMTITGRLNVPAQDASKEGIPLVLSSTSSDEYYAAVKTDKQGRFLFAFPYMEGQKEFHLVDLQDENTDLDILVDAAFCNKPVQLPYLPFSLSEDERELVMEMVRNMEFSERFAHQDEEPVILPIPFYGKSDRTLYEKEFIELDDLEEFIFELLYEARVRETNGRKSVYSIVPQTLSSLPMLVLIDNLPVTDLNEFLKVSCRRFERFEVISKGYVVGEFLYGGILAVYSEGKDLAGYKPEHNSMFFDYQLFSKPGNKNLEFGSMNEHLPLRKNTLYWETETQPLPDEKDFSFYTGDEGGEFEIVVTANLSSGEQIFSRKEFTVDPAR